MGLPLPPSVFGCMGVVHRLILSWMGNQRESWELTVRHPGNAAPNAASSIDILQIGLP